MLICFFLSFEKQDAAGAPQSGMSHTKEEDTEHELVNSKVVKSNSEIHLSTSSGRRLF